MSKPCIVLNTFCEKDKKRKEIILLFQLMSIELLINFNLKKKNTQK